jgi:translation initiation factor 4G
VNSFTVVLLRWFVNLYELDIIEEDAYLKWKEDIRDEFPGKGQALFQVNQWLLLLQEANESEAESDDD